MKLTTVPTVAEGTYHWELVFSFDNKDNPGTITDKTKIVKRRKVDYKEFLSNKLGVDAGFTYKNESSVSLKFEGVGEASDKMEFGFHLDLAYELVKTVEKNETIEETSEVERDFVVGPGGKLDLYRLTYITDGMVQKTDIVATEPGDDIKVKLKFKCVKRILGLRDILHLFSHTFPGSSNIEEWNTIRNSIVENSDRPQEEAFRNFVETLKTITPKTDNTVEWVEIRKTCTQILEAWGKEDKQILLSKLLTRFSTTKPTRHNTKEWEEIRRVSDEILGGVQSLF